MARLPKGEETSISMTFVVMCAEKMMRLFCLFFVVIYAWVCAFLPLGWLLAGSWWCSGTSVRLRQANPWLQHNRDFELPSSMDFCCTQADWLIVLQETLLIPCIRLGLCWFCGKVQARRKPMEKYCIKNRRDYGNKEH
jgi:hypothetical protein